MVAKSFTAEEICRIIEMSATVGVGLLKLPGIEISFRADFLYHPQMSSILDLKTNAGHQNPAVPASPTSEQSPRAQMMDPELLDEMRRSQLMIDDPVAFEQEMITAQMRNGYEDFEDRRTQ